MCKNTAYHLKLILILYSKILFVFLMKVQLLMTALVGVAVMSAMTSSEAFAMEVPFWYETDTLTGETYYVDHFNNGKKTWVTATPEPPSVPLPLQGIGKVIQTHAVIDSNDVENASDLTSQEIKNIKIKNEADRTYDLLATLYPGLYPVIERDITPNITVSQVITVPEPVVVPIPVPEPVPEVVVPIPEPVPVIPQAMPEVVVPIPEPVPIVPEVVVPIPEPEPETLPQITGTGSSSAGISNDGFTDERGDMSADEWDQFIQSIVPADRPIQGIEEFFGE